MGRVAGLTAAETRERLVEAAAAVFAEKGYEGARTSEIARRAGLSTGAIYSQYGTKAELLLEAVDSCAPADLDRLLAGDFGDSDSILDLLKAVAGGLPYRPKEMVGLLAEVMMTGRRDPAIGGTLARKARDRQEILAGLLRDAQATGEVDPTLPADAVARLALTLLLGTLVVLCLDLERPDRDEWTTVIDRLVESLEPRRKR